MRNDLQRGGSPRWLSLTLVTACVLMSGCKLFAPRDDSDSAKSADAKKTSLWNRPLRDERALEVERHLGGLNASYNLKTVAATRREKRTQFDHGINRARFTLLFGGAVASTGAIWRSMA